tara:strand:- start:226 stop:480 length:255 start_codon:yes stop_codon:yes gene_type:complete
MVKTTPKLVVGGLLFSLSAVGGVSAVEKGHNELFDGFFNPSNEYGPRTWWHWVNANIAQYGITKDLGTMKQIGLTGAGIISLVE